MKFESKEITKAMGAVNAITPAVVNEMKVREALLFCDALGTKRGEVYEQVYNAMCEVYHRELKREGNKLSYSFYEEKVVDGEKQLVSVPFLDCIIREFNEYPHDMIKSESGITVRENKGFTWCQKQIALDKERETPVITEEQARSIHAINSFRVWVSGYQMNQLNTINQSEVDKRVADKLDDIIKKAEEKGLEILPAHLEEKKREIMKEEKEAAGMKSASPRLFDGDSNIKAANVESLPEKPRLELIKKLAQVAPEDTAKALSAVTGKPVSFAPSLSELRPIDMIEGLRANIAAFKEPTKAGKLLNELQLMLIDSEAEPTTTGETAKAKGRATKAA